MRARERSRALLLGTGAIKAHNAVARSEAVRKIDIKDVAGLVNDIERHVADHALHLCAGEREVAVVLSPERYREFLMKGVPANVEPRIVELLDESIKKRGAVYAALAKLD